MYQFIPLTNHYWHVISCNLVILALTLSIVWVKICFVLSVSNYDSILINTVEWIVILVNCEQTDGRTTWWRTFIDHLTRQAYKANDMNICNMYDFNFAFWYELQNYSFHHKPLQPTKADFFGPFNWKIFISWPWTQISTYSMTADWWNLMLRTTKQCWEIHVEDLEKNSKHIRINRLHS